MLKFRFAIPALVALLSMATPASAGLTLAAGTGPATLATNNYGFSGTYFDLKGPGGASEKVAHPGGGPVSFLYVINPNLTVSTYFDSQAGPYDGSDDSQVAVLNNAPGVVTALPIGVGNVSNIFGFDLDGIDTFGAPGNSMDTGALGGYGGPLTFFTGVNAAKTSGVANFIGGLAGNGGTTYFSLENPPVMGTANPGVPVGGAVPEPSSLLLSGTAGAIVLAWYRRRRGAALVA